MMTSLRSRLKKMTTLALLCAFAAPLAGCYGTFYLTRNIYEYTGKVSEIEFVQTVVYIALSPAYVGAFILDTLVLNTIEFWSMNPIIWGGDEYPAEVRGADDMSSISGEPLVRIEAPTTDGETGYVWLRQDSETRFTILDRALGDAGHIQIDANGDAQVYAGNGIHVGELKQFAPAA